MNEAYRLIKLREGMWSIEDKGVRCFLLEGAQEAVLVDTGFGTGDILAAVRSVTDKPVFVVITHADSDHIGCNAQFERVYMHPADYDRYYTKTTPKTVPLPLFEGDVIDLGAFRLEVILTPGHTPGSIMLLEREKRFLIAGDIIQNGKIHMHGPGRNLHAYIASLAMLEKKYAALLDLIYASHADAQQTPDLIPALIAAAADVAGGRVQGEAPTFPLPKGSPPCKFYDCGVAGFLYDGDAG